MHSDRLHIRRGRHLQVPPFDEVLPWRDFSITLNDTRQVKTLDVVLAAISDTRLQQMRGAMAAVWPAMLWAVGHQAPKGSHTVQNMQRELGETYLGEAAHHDAFETFLLVLSRRLGLDRPRRR